MLSQRKGVSPQHKIVFDGYGVVRVALLAPGGVSPGKTH